MVVAILVAAWGSAPVVDDRGDIFEAAGEIAAYADERLQALAEGAELPDPPALRADIVTLRIALAVTLVFQVLTAGFVIFVTRVRPGRLAQIFRLGDYQPQWIVRPLLAMFVAYFGVGVYAAVATAIGLDALIPQSTVPDAVVRDEGALILAGLAAVVLAPFAEELLYRGLVFGGLLKWGFWPAAIVSSALFSGVHLDTGSFIPFFVVGMVLAWLYWSRGRLWDAIACHFFFNLTSYLILLASGM